MDVRPVAANLEPKATTEVAETESELGPGLDSLKGSMGQMTTSTCTRGFAKTYSVMFPAAVFVTSLLLSACSTDPAAGPPQALPADPAASPEGPPASPAVKPSPVAAPQPSAQATSPRGETVPPEVAGPPPTVKQATPTAPPVVSSPTAGDSPTPAAARVPIAVDIGGPVAVEATKPGLTRIGSQKCKLCHKVQYTSWAKTAHGNRTPPLDCESCHGPGSEYKSLAIMKDSKKARAAGLVIPVRAFCSQCHTTGWSDDLLKRAHAHKPGPKAP
jgi:hypothetical protein